MSSDRNSGYRPASLRGPTKLRSASTFDSGNPVLTSRTGKTENPRGRLTFAQSRTRWGASQGSGAYALGRITGFSRFPKNPLKSLRSPLADERVYDATI